MYFFPLLLEKKTFFPLPNMKILTGQEEEGGFHAAGRGEGGGRRKEKETLVLKNFSLFHRYLVGVHSLNRDSRILKRIYLGHY